MNNTQQTVNLNKVSMEVAFVQRVKDTENILKGIALGEERVDALEEAWVRGVEFGNKHIIDSGTTEINVNERLAYLTKRALTLTDDPMLQQVIWEVKDMLEQDEVFIQLAGMTLQQPDFDLEK
jgi:hypothetical protein